MLSSLTTSGAENVILDPHLPLFQKTSFWTHICPYNRSAVRFGAVCLGLIQSVGSSTQ